ncbi:hypothetical protein [Parasegetibacter sp. NRK P23]|uniref:hypothetical protein n=1 Tax=Parasegetibacter sp. NRK P23 TaxID=2942999 RepID=UPI0020440979|nr:hypothetical protein [Parasegetibacter sp. NRK P23]MCM5527241.1 hypothetical protein [Parasegetibacter sp. NRK P23]
MKDDQDYIREISEMRSLMEKSSRFLFLSGLSGIMAGIYALAGAGIIYGLFSFNPGTAEDVDVLESPVLLKSMAVGMVVLLLAVCTAVLLSKRNAVKRGEKLWNSTARRLVSHMGLPLLTGGLLLLILAGKGMIAFLAPFSMIFYGIALYNAGKYTYAEMKSLGVIQIVLGLAGTCFVAYGLLCWAIGFGVAHIIYGAYMHYRYER